MRKTYIQFSLKRKTYPRKKLNFLLLTLFIELLQKMENDITTGPYEPSVLYLQASHRSQLAWEDIFSGALLHCRRREAVLRRLAGQPDPRIEPYLRASGFYGVSCIKFIQYDWHLLTALVERWRQETHTFHMPHGECTITLQDVAIQFGLPVNGRALIGSLEYNWSNVCRDLLGVTTNDDVLKGGRLSLPWLTAQFNNFAHLPEDADEDDIQRYARAYILSLIGGVLFPDKSNSRVHLMYLPILADLHDAGMYSWGAGCLAWLYRQLCKAAMIDAKDLSGPLILLQVWAWDRFPFLAPRRLHRYENQLGDRPLAIRWNDEFSVTRSPTHVLVKYRYMLDTMRPDQIIWEPYNHLFQILPEYCLVGSHIWAARAPLMCFHVVEWQFPERVMRQFGWVQDIPIPCNTDMQLHSYDLRGRQERDWVSYLAPIIEIWGGRENSLIHGQLINGGVNVGPNYDQWYAAITRKYITQPGASYHYLHNLPNMTPLGRRCLENLTFIYRLLDLNQGGHPDGNED